MVLPICTLWACQGCHGDVRCNNVVYLDGRWYNGQEASSRHFQKFSSTSPRNARYANEFEKNRPLCFSSRTLNHEVAEQQVPILKGKLTDTSAVVVLMSCIACILSLPTRKTTDSTPVSSSCQIDYDILRAYYELGFKDGSNGSNSGASMIPRIDTCSALHQEVADSGFWGKLERVSRFASIVYIYQSVVELGIDRTTNLFSFAQLAANLQHHAKLWKKLLMLLCFYNIVKVYT